MGSGARSATAAGEKKIRLRARLLETPFSRIPFEKIKNSDQYAGPEARLRAFG
jgi:hypothetical protein